MVERRDDSLDILPLLEQLLGVGEHGLDVETVERLSGAVASASKTKSPSEKRSSSKAISVGSLTAEPTSSPPTIWPSETQRHPDPRLPSSR
jgi:hypothetical protein